MAKRQKKMNQNLVLFILLFLPVGVITSIPSPANPTNLMARIIFVFVIAIIITLAILLVHYVLLYLDREKEARKTAALQAHSIDAMTGREFELFLKHLLTARGFKVLSVYHGKDGGVDLVAKLDKKKYSIQAKRYNARKKVDRRAISDAVSGITYRKCTHAMTITNRYFTKDARIYASATNCELVDREKLAEWVLELRS